MPFETDKGGGFKIDASDLLKTGVYPERFDRQIPFWETVNGVQYTEFGMRRKAGRELIHDYKETGEALTYPEAQYGSSLEVPQYGASLEQAGYGFLAPTLNGSATPFRGITATREFNTKVAYVGDLENIYSFNLQDPITLEPSYNTVGSGYNLLATSEGTAWDSPLEFDIISADIFNGSILIRTSVENGLVPGVSVTVSGLEGFSAPNPNGVQVTGPLTGVPYPSGPGTQYISIETGTGTTETYTLNNAKVTLAATVWDVSELNGATWDEATNESDQWDFETFGSFVVGAKGSSKPVIKKNNVNFNTFHNDQVSGATILSTNTGGTGYSVGDALTTTVSSGGGSGLTATVTKVDASAIVDFKITNFGSGYANGDVVEFSGGTTPATATLTVPDIDFDSLECFHRQGPHMLAFNYSKGAVDYSTSFAWCSADNLDDWVGVATNTAGSLLIREAETPIRCVCQLGNGLAVYTDTQMFVVNYVGLPNIFGYQVALEGSVGAVSPNSVISVGRKNYGVSRDGFFVTDGSSVQMIGRESGMNQFFRDQVAQSELAQIYGFDNSKENEVVWGVPIDSASITKEIYYNYKTGQWGMRDQTISCYLDRGVFHESLSGDSSGNLYYEGSQPDLVNSNVSAITKAHDLNDADRIKEISAIRVGKEGAGSPTLSVGFSSTIDATPTFLDKDSFIIDDTFKSFPIRAAGRYITIKIESNGSADNWTITNLVVQGRMEGER